MLTQSLSRVACVDVAFFKFPSDLWSITVVWLGDLGPGQEKMGIVLREKWQWWFCLEGPQGYVASETGKRRRLGGV
jgi:hypothetical protein